MTPEQRTLRARMAAHSLHAQGGTNTKPARRAFEQRFYDQVDPNGVLPPAERERRAAHARKAYFTKLALKSAAARQSQ